jgi:protein SCO1/2
MNRAPLAAVIGAALTVGFAAMLLLVATSVHRPTEGATGSPAAAATTPATARPGQAVAGPFDYPSPVPAPALDMVDQEGRPFDLASLQGTPALVYFGYTHCPDVCPATVGVLNQVIERAGGPIRVAIVTVDPERDTPAALKEYLAYMPTNYTGLTGSASAVRTAADAWGVTYARIDTGSASGYAMAHTAEVYLVDSAGRLRAHYPFGTGAAAIVADLSRIRSD